MTHSRYHTNIGVQISTYPAPKLQIYPSQVLVMVFCLYGVTMELNTIAHLTDKG